MGAPQSRLTKHSFLLLIYIIIFFLIKTALLSLPKSLTKPKHNQYYTKSPFLWYFLLSHTHPPPYPHPHPSLHTPHLTVLQENPRRRTGKRVSRPPRLWPSERNSCRKHHSFTSPAAVLIPSQPCNKGAWHDTFELFAVEHQPTKTINPPLIRIVRIKIIASDSGVCSCVPFYTWYELQSSNNSLRLLVSALIRSFSSRYDLDCLIAFTLRYSRLLSRLAAV